MGHRFMFTERCNACRDDGRGTAYAVATHMAYPAHATSLRRLFRRVLAGVLAAPLPLALVVACSSTGTPEGDAGADGSSSGPCRVVAPPDAAQGCQGVSQPPAYFVSLTGDLSTCGFGDGGAGSSDLCSDLCGARVSSCTNTGGLVKCEPYPCAVDGRRYQELADGAAPAGRDVASCLARMAFFEAASVDAFALLERDLGLLNAPESLVRACREAKRDEARHAQLATSLATRYGALVVAPEPPCASPRSLEALATENAVEGCVRETFGVLIGMWQSVSAPTADLRAFFAALTTDELRHAALSARIDVWARAGLSAEALLRVDAAKDAALRELEASLGAAEPVPGMGLPSAAQSLALFRAWRQGETHLPVNLRPRERRARVRLGPSEIGN